MFDPHLISFDIIRRNPRHKRVFRGNFFCMHYQCSRVFFKERREQKTAEPVSGVTRDTPEDTL